MNKSEKILNSLHSLRNMINLLKNNNIPELAANKQYENKYKGKRCFILGNGPSTKQQDLTLLHDEYVFTVNQAARHKDFQKIKSTFHFWSDEHFFEINENRPEDLELLNTMKNVCIDNEEIQNFFPIEQKTFITKFGLDKTLNINYFSSNLYLTENYKKNIDFTKPIPVFGTVVQYCIYSAIYMGFSEIYLLGCDNTSLMVTLKSALKSNDADDYAYEITENEKYRMENLIKNNGLISYVGGYLLNLQGYEYLYNYCTMRNIKLSNCSAQTVIDSIPREKYEDVIARKKL